MNSNFLSLGVFFLLFCVCALMQTLKHIYVIERLICTYSKFRRKKRQMKKVGLVHVILSSHTINFSCGSHTYSHNMYIHLGIEMNSSSLDLFVLPFALQCLERESSCQVLFKKEASNFCVTIYIKNTGFTISTVRLPAYTIIYGS